MAQLSSTRRRLVRRQPHQRVAIGRREVDAVEQFLDREAMELGRHLGAAAEDARDAQLLQRHPLAQRFEELRRGEDALDVVVRLHQRQRLVDDVALVELHFLEGVALQELDHPARVQVHAETDSAAVLAEVLDGQSQAARAAGADRDPVGAFGKRVVWQRLAEVLVVDPEVVDVDARLGHTRAAAGFEDVHGLARVAFRHPLTHGASAQPFVFESAELVQVGVGVDILAGVPACPGGPVEPERTPGGRVEMPLNHFAHPGVQPLARGFHRGRQRGRRHRESVNHTLRRCRLAYPGWWTSMPEIPGRSRGPAITRGC